MDPHEILTALVEAKNHLHAVKARTLRLDGRRRSDQIHKKRMAAELLNAERAVLEAEYRALLYVDAHS